MSSVLRHAGYAACRTGAPHLRWSLHCVEHKSLSVRAAARSRQEADLRGSIGAVAPQIHGPRQSHCDDGSREANAL